MESILPTALLFLQLVFVFVFVFSVIPQICAHVCGYSNFCELLWCILLMTVEGHSYYWLSLPVRNNTCRAEIELEPIPETSERMMSWASEMWQLLSGNNPEDYCASNFISMVHTIYKNIWTQQWGWVGGFGLSSRLRGTLRQEDHNFKSPAWATTHQG